MAALFSVGCTTETRHHPVAVARTDPALISPSTTTTRPSTTSNGTGAASGQIDASTVNVPWPDYPPTLQGAIDGLIRNHDCTGLHQQLLQAAQSGASVQAQHGHDNGELIKYITVGARFVGCAV